jgi:hypothetical protein
MSMDSEDLDETGSDTEATMEALLDGIGVVNGFIQATAPTRHPLQSHRVGQQMSLPKALTPR